METPRCAAKGVKIKAIVCSNTLSCGNGEFNATRELSILTSSFGCNTYQLFIPVADPCLREELSEQCENIGCRLQNDCYWGLQQSQISNVLYNSLIESHFDFNRHYLGYTGGEFLFQILEKLGVKKCFNFSSIAGPEVKQEYYLEKVCQYHIPAKKQMECTQARALIYGEWLNLTTC
jgi:hypothetical protein